MVSLVEKNCVVQGYYENKRWCETTWGEKKKKHRIENAIPSLNQK